MDCCTITETPPSLGASLKFEITRRRARGRGAVAVAVAAAAATVAVNHLRIIDPGPFSPQTAFLSRNWTARGAQTDDGRTTRRLS